LVRLGAIAFRGHLAFAFSMMVVDLAVAHRLERQWIAIVAQLQLLIGATSPLPFPLSRDTWRSPAVLLLA